MTAKSREDMPGRISRRSFLKRAPFAATGPLLLPRLAFGANERVAVGCIGVGPQGNGVMGGFLNDERARVVAVCDVNTSRRDATCDRVKKHYGDAGCAAYRDFRELLARDDIDAVLIASPDHWHVLHGLYAARAGKDMYIEKPLGLSLAEAQALRREIHRYGRIFQFGTQQRSDRNFRFACELVRNRYIGELKRIKVGAPASHGSGNLSPMPVPDWLDYDLWLGPAPWAPYNENRIVNDYWWHNTDYALGFISGWGIHHVDIAQWGCGADDTGPIEIEGTGVFPSDGFCDCATSWNVWCKYANGVEMEFTDNAQLAQGVRFEGTEGWVYVRRGFINAEPRSLLTKKLYPNDLHLYESGNHVGNFVECVRSRRDTVCPIDVAVRTDTVCQLSNIATRTGRTIHWDPAKECIVGDNEASRMLARAMRAPWHL
ncbi:MAG TPA: Gfo/Idh/MocA family oxidoreductase [Candidatus Hydrogenedentes bacterium]|nr:Gfo/Idh/MocA family oxidoreductase [Candidatus Hydrogenedentota bacterium]HPG66904.1 Gfo/Idh/MocA family oxidoreductase [Candidatus Hydrogenedentota bacterium]